MTHSPPFPGESFMSCDETSTAPLPDKYDNSLHRYNILYYTLASPTPPPDESFMSCDDLRLNLWNLDQQLLGLLYYTALLLHSTIIYCTKP